jgi:uncharacterized cupin superfamily protein
MSGLWVTSGTYRRWVEGKEKAHILGGESGIKLTFILKENCKSNGN